MFKTQIPVKKKMLAIFAKLARFFTKTFLLMNK